MRDAYAVGRCGAMAGSEAELSGLRGPMGINRLASRIVPEALALFPVVVVTGATDDEWSRLVFWLTRALMDKTTEPNLPAGVRPDWHQEVGSLLNGYGTMPGREDADRLRAGARPGGSD